MNFYTVLKAVLIIIIINSLDIFGEEGDTTVVQTLTFDDITKRRSVWQFPENTDYYRKIIALYTLKCDRQTAQDVYDCGEWDTGANIYIYQHTGVTDSNLVQQPKYNYGGGFPEKIYYTQAPTRNGYRKTYHKKTVTKVNSETEFQVAGGDDEITLGNTPAKLQMLFTKDFSKENDLSGRNFQRIKIFVKTPGITLKNFTVKAANSGLDELTEMEESGFSVLFQGDITFEEQGWHYIDLNNELKVNSFFGFILQFSYDEMTGGNEIVLSAGNHSDCVISDFKDSYLDFDGSYDRVDCGILEQLKGEQKFTVEMKLRIDRWRGGGTIFRAGNALQFRTVEEYMQPRRYYWRLQDGDDFGILVGGSVDHSSNWKHFAMVYDGTKDQYEGRIKFFIDGNEVTSHIRGKFPDAFPDSEEFLRLSWTGGNIKSAMDEFRIWSGALDGAAIKEWQNKAIDESHPFYDKIAVYYSMDNVENNILPDESGQGQDGILIGAPAVRHYNAEDNSKKLKFPGKIPNVIFCEGDYETAEEDYFVIRYLLNSPVSIVTYKIEDRQAVIDSIRYVWEPGTFYTYDEDGNPVDSMTVAAQDSVLQDTLKYYSEPFEIVNRREIARSITPYGKFLELGPEGFTWVYDLTDYAPWLKGEVDMAAHNQYELIDLKFLFIEGTPPRDVKKIETIWNDNEATGIKYKFLSDDSRMNKTEVPLLPEAEEFKVRIRMTGHGHYSNNGNYPHCCEWKDNTHYLYVNDNLEYEWHIWKPYECAWNPVYPQGGTWPGAREGWCPGDIVKEQDFELTPFIDGDTVSLDYDITPVPEDNLRMGEGNYWTTVHFFHYGKANFENDAEIYLVKQPSDAGLFRRENPVCKDILVVLRNNGRNVLTSADFEYYVSGGEKETYSWSGSLMPHQTEEVYLPVPSEAFWLGDGEDVFTVTVVNPNGIQDEYAANDSYSTEFIMTDMFSENITLFYKTNLRPETYTVQIKDIESKVIWSMTGLTANKIHRKEINLPKGCYTLEVRDPYHYGLSYWAYQDQGHGYIKIIDAEEKTLKAFESDFGAGFNYSFHLGDISSVRMPGFETTADLFPNPSKNEITLRFKDELGETRFEIYNEAGVMIKREKGWIFNGSEKRIDISRFIPRAYYVKIISGETVINKEFVKQD